MEVSPCELIDITIGRMKKSDITYIVLDISPGWGTCQPAPKELMLGFVMKFNSQIKLELFSCNYYYFSFDVFFIVFQHKQTLLLKKTPLSSLRGMLMSWPRTQMSKWTWWSGSIPKPQASWGYGNPFFCSIYRFSLSLRSWMQKEDNRKTLYSCWLVYQPCLWSEGQ